MHAVFYLTSNPANYTKWTNFWENLTPLDSSHLEVFLGMFWEFFIFLNLNLNFEFGPIWYRLKPNRLPPVRWSLTSTTTPEWCWWHVRMPLCWRQAYPFDSAERERTQVQNRPVGQPTPWTEVQLHRSIRSVLLLGQEAERQRARQAAHGRGLPTRNACSLHPQCHKAVVIIKSTERPLHISETPIIKPPLLTGTHHRPCQSYLRSKTNEERTSQNKQIKTSEI